MSGKRTINISITPGQDDRTEEKVVHQMVGQALRMIGDDLNFKYNNSVRNGQCLSEVITTRRVKEVFKYGKP